MSEQTKLRYLLRELRERIIVVTAILQVGHFGIALQLILVIGGFKKYGVSYLCMPLPISDGAL